MHYVLCLQAYYKSYWMAKEKKPCMTRKKFTVNVQSGNSSEQERWRFHKLQMREGFSYDLSNMMMFAYNLALSCLYHGVKTIPISYIKFLL